MNTCEVTAYSSSATIHRWFRSAPFLHWAVHWCCPVRDRQGTSMSQRGHLGWGRLTSSSLPRCPGRSGARSASACPSVLSHGCYTPPLGRTSSLPSSGTSSCTPWACWPCLLRHPHFLVPPLLCRAGFGGAHPLNPSQIPSRTMVSNQSIAILIMRYGF